MEQKQIELLIRLDERVESFGEDISDIKKRLKLIEESVAEERNKRLGMYTIVGVIGAAVSWLISNLYAFKSWMIP
jgi:hypothetical protein